VLAACRPAQAYLGRQVAQFALHIIPLRCILLVAPVDSVIVRHSDLSL
jgi:hypothetical protein